MMSAIPTPVVERRRRRTPYGPAIDTYINGELQRTEFLYILPIRQRGTVLIQILMWGVLVVLPLALLS